MHEFDVTVNGETVEGGVRVMDAVHDAVTDHAIAEKITVQEAYDEVLGLSLD